MAFFEDLGKKLTQASQNTIQKTKGIADTAKISAMISEEEKKIRNNYQEIGELYVSLHSEDAEDALALLVQDVKDAQKRITDYRQQIQDIKGYVRCEKCGTEVPITAAFCSGCGMRMNTPIPVPVQDVLLCANCGAALSAGTKFCTKCGTPVEQHEPEQTTATSYVKTCENCGATMDADTDFCTECGKKL